MNCYRFYRPMKQVPDRCRDTQQVLGQTKASVHRMKRSAGKILVELAATEEALKAFSETEMKTNEI